MIESVSMMLITANMAAYIFLKTLLFDKMVTEQINNILNDKQNVINRYIKYNDSFKYMVKSQLESQNLPEICKNSQKQKKSRYSCNSIRNNKEILLVLGILILFCVYFVYDSYKNSESGEFVNIMYILLFSLIINVISNFILYKGIIGTYEYYGDQKLYSTLYDSLKKNMGRQPMTKKGRELENDLQKVISKEIKFTDLLKRNPDVGSDLWKSYNEVLDSFQE